MKPLPYTVFAGLLVAGIAGGFLLAPDASEMGLLYFKAHQNEEARRILEGRIAAGEHSIDVTVPLADLYVQTGEVDRALELLKRFPVRPDERLALAERIGQFERYGQLTKEYLHTLETINHLRKSAISLRELAGLYRYFDQPAPLSATLQQLVRSFQATPDELLELANLQAIAGQYAQAALTLERLAKAHSDAMNGDTLEFLISVLLDSGQPDRAQQRAAQWLAAHPNPNAAIRLAGLLDSKGQPSQGLRLLAPFEAQVDSNPALLVEWVHLQMATGSSERAYNRLNDLYRAGKLPDEAVEPFLDMALARQDAGLATAVAEKRGLARLPNWLLANLVEAAMTAKRTDLVHRVADGLTIQFLEAKPLLAAKLALARGDRLAAGNWLGEAAASSLSDLDRLAVAESFLQLERRSEAFDQVSQLHLESLSPAEGLEAARVYLNVGKAKDGAARFALLWPGGEPPPGTQGAAGWALLAAATGREAAVVKWLDSLSPAWLTEDFLRDLYFVANDHHETALAVSSATRVYGRHATDANRLLLAEALTTAGRGLDALPHLRFLLKHTELGPDTRDALDETYTTALRQAGLMAELREFWTAQLARPGLDEKRRLDLIYGLVDIKAWKEALPPLAELAARHEELVPLYVESVVQAGRKQDVVNFLKGQLDRKDLGVKNREACLYALIEHGGYEVSLPYIRALALASGGPWIAAYQDALRQLDRTDELAVFWTTRATRADATPEQKRSLAFQLLDLGRKDSATAIFQDLARSARPDSQDVADLLFLWGPKPGPGALVWLEQRARNATGSERAAWWNHLLDLGAADRVVTLAANKLPPPGEGGALFESYLRALAQLGDKRQFAAAIDRELVAFDRPEPARRLARLARESGIDAAAEAAYSRVTALAPGDLEARHWLGTYTFSRGAYSSAEGHLKVLLDSVEGSYDDNFYYAEILWRKGSRGRARLYYSRAIRSVAHLPSPPPEALLQRAHALARCGFLEKSLQEFRSLIAASPGNQDLRADFVAILLENSRYAEARSVLSTSSGSEGSRLVALRAQLLAATAQKKEARELLENFIATYPESAQAFAGLAGIDQSLDLNRRSLALFGRAHNLEPENEDYGKALEEAARDQAPHVETEFLRRTVQGEESEDLVRIIGEQVLGHALKIHFDVDQDAASISGIRSPSGAIVAFRGVARRGEASVQYETENGLRIEGDLYASDARPGVGAAVVKPDAKGSNSIRLEIGRSYWELPQSLAQGGTRDRVEIRREVAVGSRVSASLTAALNRYNLMGAPDAASSAVAQGRLTIGVLSRPRLSFEYNLDGEYKLSAASRADAAGSLFQHLPLLSREVHSLGVAVAVEPVRHLQANVSGGYAFDRLGGRAPFITLNLDYRDKNRFAGGFDFDRRLYFLNTARTETIIGGHLSFRF